MTKKNVTLEDRDLFRQAVGDVRAIKKDKILLKHSYKPKPAPSVSSVVDTEQFTDFSDAEVEKLGIHDELNYAAFGIQHNVIRKLRRGQIPVDAEIDLHGLSSDGAKQQLMGFLQFSVEQGYRCLRIVHGKGYRSADNYPVLKNNLNLWLRQCKNVQAFCSTPIREGGTGALFVLLRVAK